MTETPSPAPPTSDAPVPAAPPKPGCLTVGSGCLLVLIGIPMLICPGPGVATIASGIAMIGAGLVRNRR